MELTVVTSLKKNQKNAVHPSVRVAYLSRVCILIVALILVSSTLYSFQVDFYFQKIIILSFIWLIWPHVAYRLSINSKDRKKAEIRNYLFDFMSAGFAMGLMELNFWSSVPCILIVFGNSIIIRGFPFLLKSIPAFIFGLCIKFLFFSVSIDSEPILMTSFLAAAMILFYVLLISKVTHHQTRKRIQAKKQIEIKNTQLQKLSTKLSEFLPSQLVDNISDGQIESVSKHHRKKLTLFFSDIKDFTKITDALEPEDMANLLNDYLTEMNKIINKYQGTLAQVIGDGLYVFFGAPNKTNDKDHAIRCLKMSIDMQSTMKEFNKKWFNIGLDEVLQIRCGINTGMATVGGYGSSERKEYTAMGMQVNIAARLESACSPGKILMNHTTWVLVKDDIPCLEKGKLEVKGYHLPLRVYEIQL